jgi:hypothetical protein
LHRGAGPGGRIRRPELAAGVGDRVQNGPGKRRAPRETEPSRPTGGPERFPGAPGGVRRKDPRQPERRRKPVPLEVAPREAVLLEADRRKAVPPEAGPPEAGRPGPAGSGRPVLGSPVPGGRGRRGGGAGS